MSHNGCRDRLIDLLLRELLGDESPPDLCASVMSRAGGRAWRWVLAGAAAAAVLALAAGLWWLVLAYPTPRGTGPLRVAGGGSVRRGATVLTAERPASLALGGYCRIELHPGSRARITGQRGAEGLFLEEGGVTCEVKPGEGRFAVATPLGTVTVTGTEFTVQLLEGDDRMSGKQMLVRVLVGAVLVSGAWGQVALAEGDERRLPERREARADGTVPDALQGFRGTLIGTIASVGAKGFTLTVANARATEGSRAENVDGAIGQAVPIHYTAFVGRDGAYRPSEDLRNAVRRLRDRGGLVTVRVRTDDGVLIADRVWAGAQLNPDRRDPARPRREGERRGEGDREGEGRRERRGEGDREGEGDRRREGDGERRPDGEGERRREGDGERRREGEVDRPREGEGDRRREGDGERRPDGEGERRREGDGERRREGEVDRPREGEGDRRREGDGERRREGDREGTDF